MSRRIAGLMCVAAATLVGVGAAETPAPSPVASSASEQRDSISAAKREFESMKAARDPSQPQKGGVPRLTLPQLPSDPGQANPFQRSKAEGPPAAKKKSGNWLLEAMEKSEREAKLRSRADPDSPNARERERAETEELVLGSTERELEAPGLAQSGDEKQRPAVDAKEKPEVVNPLTQYLADWLTPRDYAVLKPGLEESFAGKSGGEPAAGDAMRLDLPASLGAGVGTAFTTSSGPGPSMTAPRENPYLQELVAPALQGTPLFTPPPAALAPPPRQTAPVMAPLPAPVAPAPSKIPDFAKPVHDDKYFKQLKRF